MYAVVLTIVAHAGTYDALIWLDLVMKAMNLKHRTHAAQGMPLQPFLAARDLEHGLPDGDD